ncbi:hypothetical protein BS47DRAFT_183374 [Hydnum rufescens UP504]|uniref:Uncharacterized protein n=1 Tax=Hydnum rufescens UP504 TaxID=1448309 RepID=A0A9P6DSV6_9AGAM|nr:hypothetical protein BS47DRAFT_183374 [Hydnum rufescens UP504]
MRLRLKHGSTAERTILGDIHGLAILFTEADIYAGVSITGSVSQSSAAQFCVNPHFGVAPNAGLTGSVLFGG